jgi:hypothetical protein
MLALVDVDPPGFDGDVIEVLESRVYPDDEARILDAAETVAVGGDA